MILLLSFSYLTKEPKEYICTYRDNSQGKCTTEEFCGNNDVLSYEPNMEHEDSLVNWIGKFDLACASEVKTNMISGALLTGWLCTLLFLPRLSDLYGRLVFMNYGNLV